MLHLFDEWESVPAEAMTQVQCVCFSATWCAPCRALKPKLEDLARDWPDVAFLYTTNTELAAELGVTAFPTLMVFQNSKRVHVQKGGDLHTLDLALKKATY